MSDAAISAELDLDLTLIEDLEFSPECESIHHGAEGDREAASHEGPAAWMQFGPCEHTTGFRCDKSVQVTLTRMANPDFIFGACFPCQLPNVKPTRFEPLTKPSGS